MEGGGTNGVARDPETRGKVIPTGPPPRGSQLMGRNGPGRWGRHAVAEPRRRKTFRTVEHPGIKFRHRCSGQID